MQSRPDFCPCYTDAYVSAPAWRVTAGRARECFAGDYPRCINWKSLPRWMVSAPEMASTAAATFSGCSNNCASNKGPPKNNHHMQRWDVTTNRLGRGTGFIDDDQPLGADGGLGLGSGAPPQILRKRTGHAGWPPSPARILKWSSADLRVAYELRPAEKCPGGRMVYRHYAVARRMKFLAIHEACTCTTLPCLTLNSPNYS